MLKRAFFLFVMFGVVLAGAMVTSASPADPAEVVAAASSDTLAPAATGSNFENVIVNTKPIGCKYPDNCPPPPPPPPPVATCVATVDIAPWVVDPRSPNPSTATKFGISQFVSASHTGCGNDAPTQLVAGESGIFTPGTSNPFSYGVGATCELISGTWVFSSGFPSGIFVVEPTNGSTYTPVPVPVSATAQDCANLDAGRG